MNLHRLFRISAIPAALALLSACGGGGGGGDDAGGGGGGGGGGGSGTGTVFGTAAKGLIANGNVQAFEITGGTLVSRGTATTNAQGRYSLSLAGYGGGPVVVQISGGPGATMKCDVRAGCGGTAFGQPLPVSSAFVMRTLLPSVGAGASVNRCITPFTELAVRRATERAGTIGSITPAAANDALSEVSQLVGGAGVLRTCVVDLTDPDEVDDADSAQLALSGLSAAVLAVNGASDPAAALNGLGNAFAGGDIAASDLQSLLDAAKTELAAASPGDETNTAYLAMQDDIGAAGAGGTVDPQPSANANQNGVEQGKALVDEVRSLVFNLIQDREAADTNAAVQAFKTQLEAAETAVDASPIGDDFGIAVDAAVTFYETVAEGAVGQTQSLSTTDSAGMARVATITVSKPANGNDSVRVVGTVGDFTTDLAINAPGDVTIGGSTPTNFAGSLDGSMVNTSGRGVRAVLSGDVSANGITYDAASDRFGGTSVAFDGSASFEQIGVADPFRFSGTVSLDVVDCTECADSVVEENGEIDDDVAINLDQFTLQGTFGNSRGNFDARVSVDMDTASAASFDHRLPVGVGNVPSGKVSVQLTAALDGFHAYGVTALLELDDITSIVDNEDGRDLYDVDATLTAAFRRDGKTITVTAVAQAPTAAANVIDLGISNQDGVVLTFDNLSTGDDDRISGVVRVGETPVGTVEETERGTVLIRWSDGTFESVG